MQFNSDENLVVFAEHRQGREANQYSDAGPTNRGSRFVIVSEIAEWGKQSESGRFEPTLKKARILEMMYSGST